MGTHKRSRSLGQNNKGRKGPTGKQWGFIALAALGLFAVTKITGAFGKTKPPPPIDLPDAGSGIPEGWSPRPLAQELYDVLKGVAWNPALAIKRDAVLLQLIALSTNDMFVAVYNDFTQNFGGGKTLREWIDDEYLIPSTITAQLNARFNTNSLSGWLYTPGIDPNREFYNWNPVYWQNQYAKAGGTLDSDLQMITNKPW